MSQSVVKKNQTLNCFIMKLSLYFLLFFCLVATSMVHAQNPKNIHIAYKVNAEAIFNGGDVAGNSQLSDDNNGKSPDGNPTKFESKGYISKNVNWEIKAIGENASSYQVKFLDFPWSGDIDAFEKNPIPGGGRKAKAKIKDNSGEGTIKYTIRFTIKSSTTGETKTFNLDPRLKVVRQS